MQFHVAQLLKEHTGAVRRFQMNEPIRQLSAEDMTIEAPLTGEVSLMRDTDGILVTGHLETEVSVPCARCPEPVTVPVEMELEEQYYPTIDVETGHKVPVPEDADPDTRIAGHHISTSPSWCARAYSWPYRWPRSTRRAASQPYRRTTPTNQPPTPAGPPSPRCGTKTVRHHQIS